MYSRGRNILISSNLSLKHMTSSVHLWSSKTWPVHNYCFYTKSSHLLILASKISIESMTIFFSEYISKRSSDVFNKGVPGTG